MSYMRDLIGRRLDQMRVLSLDDGDARYGTRGLVAPLTTGSASRGTLPATVAARTIREYPTWRKHTSLVMPFASQAAPSVLAMNFIDMRGWPGVGPGKRQDCLYLYGTDHGTDPNTNGIYIAEADDPYGTNLSTKGRVLSGGTLQPEAPFVWLDWDLTVLLGTGNAIAASTGRVTKASHGLPDGKKVILTALTGSTGLTAGATYFVVNSTVNTFQLALTEGGAAVAVAGDGTASLSYVGALCMLVSENTGTTWSEEAQSTQIVGRYLSPTGLAGTWIREGDCFVKTSPFRPGVPVTEYANVVRLGDTFYAFTIDGGGAYCLWMSTRGGAAGTWSIVGDRILNQNSMAMHLPDYTIKTLVKLGQGLFTYSRGSVFFSGPITAPAAGVEGFAFSDLYVAPMRTDLRGLSALPTLITPPKMSYDVDAAGRYGSLGHPFQWNTDIVAPYRVGEKNTDIALLIMNQGSLS